MSIENLQIYIWRLEIFIRGKKSHIPDRSAKYVLRPALRFSFRRFNTHASRKESEHPDPSHARVSSAQRTTIGTIRTSGKMLSLEDRVCCGIPSVPRAEDSRELSTPSASTRNIRPYPTDHPPFEAGLKNHTFNTRSALAKTKWPRPGSRCQVGLKRI